ncbi:NAD(P)H-quinone oxidoreductase subunit I, chloroplastic [Dehalococcoides mccartyi]|uniref:NAD(P)H-quinone oxidoreductase subunit I, chloroplastic n=1 Tax=Dehalococcoides mccartyi TaxID=61435 RepID=A0A2J1DXM5_9CHLR|nr:NAD(P)H-quinone oxidoreductase subunit I, chloroplastic [Dehalococcoides mccartyi]
MSGKIKIMQRKGKDLCERLYLIEVFKGMAVTFGHFLSNFLDNSKLYVRHYPEQKPEITARWRGRHRLTKHEDGTSSRNAPCRASTPIFIFPLK